MNLDSQPYPTSRMGLIADTHGNYPALKRAVDTLLSQGVQQIIHLGDFCDSVRQDQLPQIFDLLDEHQILAVKGNNDYQVEKMLENGYWQDDPIKKRQWLAYLQKTPIIYRVGKVCFSHSLPYDSIRAFYEPMDTGGIDQAQQVFANTDYSMVFCGHSHNPIVFRQRNGLVSRQQIRQGVATAFQLDERYIVIVGAADNDECGIFDFESASYRRISIS